LSCAVRVCLGGGGGGWWVVVPMWARPPRCAAYAGHCRCSGASCGDTAPCAAVLTWSVAHVPCWRPGPVRAWMEWWGRGGSARVTPTYLIRHSSTQPGASCAAAAPRPRFGPNPLTHATRPHLDAPLPPCPARRIPTQIEAFLRGPSQSETFSGMFSSLPSARSWCDSVCSHGVRQSRATGKRVLLSL
jgi:hypothetical protein